MQIAKIYGLLGSSFFELSSLQGLDPIIGLYENNAGCIRNTKEFLIDCISSLGVETVRTLSTKLKHHSTDVAQFRSSYECSIKMYFHRTEVMMKTKSK